MLSSSFPQCPSKTIRPIKMTTSFPFERVCMCSVEDPPCAPIVQGNLHVLLHGQSLIGGYVHGP